MRSNTKFATALLMTAIALFGLPAAGATNFGVHADSDVGSSHMVCAIYVTSDPQWPGPWTAPTGCAEADATTARVCRESSSNASRTVCTLEITGNLTTIDLFAQYASLTISDGVGETVIKAYGLTGEANATMSWDYEIYPGGPVYTVTGLVCLHRMWEPQPVCGDSWHIASVYQPPVYPPAD